MDTIPGALFKDCQSGDFEHYFVKTILLWNLSSTKKRIFFCQEICGSEIRGQYLTRQREFKEKTFNLGAWWKELDILPPYGRTFSIGQSAATWYPSMTKNLKKSYPGVIDGSIQMPIVILGRPQAAETVFQNVLACAFGKYYCSENTPSLKEALSLPVSAVATKYDFVVDFFRSNLYLRNSIIGKINSDRGITVTTSRTKEIVVDVGEVPPEKVVVLQ